MRIRAQMLVMLSAFWTSFAPLGSVGVCAAESGGARASASKRVAARMKQYKRVHQHALDQITSGKIGEAVAYLREVAGAHPRDAETQFMLGMALARQGKTDEAVAAMRRALVLGLPPGRVIAGPRDLLKPLGEPATLRGLFANRPDWLKTLAGTAETDAVWQPVHGPMVGNVTDRSADLWIRTAAAGTYRAVAWAIDRPGGTSKEVVSQGKASSTPESDYTAVIRLTGLRPDRWYAYSVGLVDARPIAASDVRYFRTAPATGAKTRFSLVFGGGAGFVPQHERMWETVDAKRPSLLVLLGDNVYIDHPKSPRMQRYCYYRRQSRPEFRTLVAHTPVYTIWDDHDFATNDCWGGPEVDSPAWKRSVWNVYRQNWANPGYGGGERQPGCWYVFNWGDVEFFMLDCRYYRTDPKVAKPSMLGPVQMRWLEGKLRASKATFKVICSSVPFDYRTKGDSLDTWNGFRAEREALFGLLEREKIDGVVLMSADRHRSDLWKIEREHGYALYEFSSSRLTNQHLHKTMPAAEFSYNKKQSFGLVAFDTIAADPTVSYKVVTIDGETVHQTTIKRSRLTHQGR